MKISNWGNEYEVRIKEAEYYNGNLAIMLECYDGEYGFWEPYGNLTVNFEDPLPDGYAYVDTNNMPNAEEFINKYNLGEHTGECKASGYCTYPLYKFY